MPEALTSRSTVILNDLRWLVRLRWLAGAGIMLGVTATAQVTQWSPANALTLAIGAIIILYNGLLWLALRRAAGHAETRRWLHTLAWTQIVLDLLCLTVATMLTGAMDSPFRVFFVLHMILSSMLLPLVDAYLSAALAVLMFIVGLSVTGQLPHESSAVVGVGLWAAVLMLTVFLSGRIARDLRRHDVALVEQNERMRAVMHTAVDGIITIDERGIIHAANPAVEEMFGYQRGELLGENVNVLMPEPTRSAHDGYLRDYLRTRQARIIGIGREVVGLRRDGTSIPLDLSVSEVLLGGRTLFTGIVRDISERKQAEEHVDALNRTLQRQQQAMMQQEKMAATGQMAAGIVHEIANPLASLDSVLQLAQRQPERVGEQTLTTLREQVLRIHRIVRQLTDFAHPNETAWETRSLNDLVASTLEMMRFDRRMKDVNIQCELAPDVEHARVMPPAIQQVLVNMLMNALDAVADVPEPRLTIITALRDGWNVIEIRDNGRGIAAADLPHVFEPFFTTKPLGRGTGLGLSISYSLVKRHGGECEVVSRPGEGATFRVLLPRVEDDAA
jgi:two-component system sensor kinase FixL